VYPYLFNDYLHIIQVKHLEHKCVVVSETYNNGSLWKIDDDDYKTHIMQCYDDGEYKKLVDDRKNITAYNTVCLVFNTNKNTRI